VGRYQDNIKIDFEETGYEGVGWIQLAENKVPFWAVVISVTKFEIS
jgi:hypothetical protein